MHGDEDARRSAVRASRRFVVGLLALTLIGACSNGGSTGGTGTTGSSGATHTGTDTSTKTSAPCPYRDFAVGKTPLVQLQPPSSSATELSARRQVPCQSILSMNQGGAADVYFGQTAACQVAQDQPDAGKVARIVTRDPMTALFRIAEGRALCTIGTAETPVKLCGLGTLLLKDPTQTAAVCDPEPVFGVAAYAGSLQVIDPNGDQHTVPAGMQLVYSFETGDSRIENAQFNPPDEALFAAQAAAIGLLPLLRRNPEVTWDGGPLMATDGEWSASPAPTFAYRWQTCASFEDDAACTDITGQTGSTYAPSRSDCPAVRVVVTARNVHGSNDAPSRPFDLDILGIDCTTTSVTASTGPTGPG